MTCVELNVTRSGPLNGKSQLTDTYICVNLKCNKSCLTENYSRILDMNEKYIFICVYIEILCL